MTHFKAISIRQPWASLIVMGLKTIEVRSWTSNYRGTLLIHASRTPDEQAMRRFQFDNLPFGSIIGTAELANAVPFSQHSWDELADEHLQIGQFLPGLYAWFLTNPRPLAKPVPYCGMRGLFAVCSDLLSG